jgi:UDP-GlcNAc:undecaprenyl-phosphate GlcNAc-1-phosphate transferase
VENLPLYISAFSVSAMLIFVCKDHAARVGLIDRPCERKRHCGEVPLIGGLAIFSAFLIALLTSSLSVSHYSALLAGCAILVLVGVLDDIKALPSGPRFLAQITAGIVMCIWGGVVLRDLGALLFDGALFTLGSMAVPFTIFSTVGVINAVNMSDGIDGLCGSLTLVALAGLALAAYAAGATAPFTMISLLMSTVAAFLFFNIRFPKRSRALVFLGDAGSMFLGFALAWFVVSLSQGENRIIAPVTALWFLAMPLFDTVGIMIRRVMKGRSPFAADREHFHHAFQLAGFSVLRTHLTITGLAVMFMIIGLAGQFAGAPEIVMFYLFLGVFGLYFWGMLRAWKFMRFLRRTMHLEKETAQHSKEAANPVFFRDGHVEDLRSYYLQQKASQQQSLRMHEEPNAKSDANAESARVPLKLVVNATGAPPSETLSHSVSPE